VVLGEDLKFERYDPGDSPGFLQSLMRDRRRRCAIPRGRDEPASAPPLEADLRRENAFADVSMAPSAGFMANYAGRPCWEAAQPDTIGSRRGLCLRTCAVRREPSEVNLRKAGSSFQLFFIAISRPGQCSSTAMGWMDAGLFSI